MKDLTRKIDELINKVNIIMDFLDIEEEDEEGGLSEEEEEELKDDNNIPDFHNYGELSIYNEYLMDGDHFGVSAGKYEWQLPITKVRIFADLEEDEGIVNISDLDTQVFLAHTDRGEEAKENCIELIKIYMQDEWSAKKREEK